MKIIRKDLKEGIMKIMPQTLEDLWTLEKLIKEGDLVSAESLRTFKTDTLREKSEKKKVFITISSEKVEFAESANRLRITGTIVSGRPEEYVQVGSHHTLDAEPKRAIKIRKEKWMNYELKMIDEAITSALKPKLLILLLDREDYLFSIVRQSRVEYLSEGSTRISGKDDIKTREKTMDSFVSSLHDLLKDLTQRERIEKIVIAGPGFMKEEFKKYLEKEDKELAKNSWVFDTSSVSKSGVNELLKRGVVEKVIGESKLSYESQLMEVFLEKLVKGNLSTYGPQEVMKAIEYGAVEKLLVLDEVLRKQKETEKIMSEAEKKGAEVIIFESENEPGQKLKSFGGLAGILRYPIY